MIHHGITRISDDDNLLEATRQRIVSYHIISSSFISSHIISHLVKAGRLKLSFPMFPRTEGGHREHKLLTMILSLIDANFPSADAPCCLYINTAYAARNPRIAKAASSDL